MKRVFISYSANREDVFIHRLFGLKDKGFYVDIGAAHPVFENDTKSLYDRGWRGINVEPNEKFFNKLVEDRSEDINLNLAISDQSGSLVYFEVAGTGLSTCDSEEARRALSKGHEVSSFSIKATTLREVFAAHSVAQVDILKVDVEGFELRVLRSNDWDVVRPSLVIVEATYPETPVRRPDEITPFMQQRAYKRVYFDGLNDYFVAHEFTLDEGVFECPPNIFDGFLPYREKMLEDSSDNNGALSERLASELRSSREEVILLSEKVASHSCEQQKLRDCSAQLVRLESELQQSRDRNSALAQQLERVSGLAMQSDQLAHTLQLAHQEIAGWRDRYAKLSAQIDQFAIEPQVNSPPPPKYRTRGLKKILRAIKRPRHTVRELWSR